MNHSPIGDKIEFYIDVLLKNSITDDTSDSDILNSCDENTKSDVTKRSFELFYSNGDSPVSGTALDTAEERISCNQFL